MSKIFQNLLFLFVCCISDLLLLSSFSTATATESSTISSSTTTGLFFYEVFEQDPFSSSSHNKWIKSSDTKYANQPLKWIESSSSPPGFENDKGIMLSEEMKFYGFGTKFCKDNNCQKVELSQDDDKTEIVIQYELKFDDSLSCGGAYIKLLRDVPDFNLAGINNDSPYTIMFGPDKCGGNGKIHFILQHQNPVTKEWEEKHFNDSTAMIKDDKKTHLYTLVLQKTTNHFEIFIDKVSFKKGNLLTHMTPAINPPVEINDPDDTKPTDWVDAAKIEDSAAEKPADWYEEAPVMIMDESSVKPDGWLNDVPLEIPDPELTKPEDWSDEEDGEWEAPTIPNPACQTGPGCGEWKPAMIKNPAYKGKWRRPMIDNPEYKGEWSPRKIPNPSYFNDSSPALTMAPIIALAVEVWTTNKGILFDNFVLSHSKDTAFQFATETFDIKSKAEMEQEKTAQALNKKNNKNYNDKTGGSNVISLPFGIEIDIGKYQAMAEYYLTEYVKLVMQLISIGKTYSESQPYAVAGAVVVALLSLVYLLYPGARYQPPPPTPRRSSSKKDTADGSSSASSSSQINGSATAAGDDDDAKNK